MQYQFGLRVADLRALAQLATDATVGVTDVVEAMHAGIVRPLGLAHPKDAERTARIAGFVYKAVRGTTRLAGGALDMALAWPHARGHAGSSAERDAVISALNGVLGDRLEASNNALALTMTLCVDGRAIPAVPRGKKLLLLVHGLCMNDRQWLHNGHDHGAALAAALGFTPLYLRYNTGRSVATNGRDLANLLNALVRNSPELQEIAIVAHSMGGLVVRSALAQGEAAKHAWIAQTPSVVFLGTPHLGAPLEQGGHWVDVILGAAPFAKPLARIGKIRSQGIVDLRHGCIDAAVPSGAAEPSAVLRPPRPTRFFSIAATLSGAATDLGSSTVGDGLVPVNSALAIRNGRSAFANSRQWVVLNTGHLDLLSSPQVHAKLASWLG